ncbi:MAG: NAD(P)/FAD-dependent oxidoreductase, partial [Candidatus Bathyarchaeota archaeon]|nr:NAD(P)/FAD-dependent oxidoreductase [Candidatus Bathyarchaeota archaeon]
MHEKPIRVAVIGAGIVGASISRVLSMFEDFEVVLVEKEADVGWGVSKANTGIIHAGYDDEPELYPLRAKLCVEGNGIWRKWTEELDIPVKWCGSLVLAFNEGEAKILEELFYRGLKNGVKGLEKIDAEEIRVLEPNASENAVAALWAPSAGQISPWEAVIALVDNSVANGVKLSLSTEVKGVKVKDGRVLGLETSRGFLEADWIINASGLYADKISEAAGVRGYRIKPRRGEYFVFDKEAEPKVARILFPTPTPISKGVVVTTTVDGNLMIGPSAEDLAEDERDEKGNTRSGLEYVWSSASRLVKRLPPRGMVIRFFAGLRPEPTGGDFIVRRYDEVYGFIDAAGMRSPGLTSAPAVAYMVLEMLRSTINRELKRKGGWNPYRRRTPRFSDLTHSERSMLISREPRYGRIICVDEMVTEMEVIEAIKRGATTIDGVKFRTGACMGKCQGSSCMYKIALILSRELRIPLWKVSVKGPGTEIGLGDIKALFEGREAQCKRSEETS